MRAAIVTAFTGHEGIRIGEVPEPVPGAGQVLVDVERAGVLFPDVLLARGEYQVRPDPPFVAGLETAGRVRADAAGFRAGDRVAAFTFHGGFAETVASRALRTSARCAVR
jgi:NADPH:quinone reductase